MRSLYAREWSVLIEVTFSLRNAKIIYTSKVAGSQNYKLVICFLQFCLPFITAIFTSVRPIVHFSVILIVKKQMNIAKAQHNRPSQAPFETRSRIAPPITSSKHGTVGPTVDDVGDCKLDDAQRDDRRSGGHFL